MKDILFDSLTSTDWFIKKILDDFNENKIAEDNKNHKSKKDWRRGNKMQIRT